MPETTSIIDTLLSHAIEAFQTRFDRSPTMAAAAPGRVNLMGEHTDYNQGYVLPIAIDHWSVVVGDLTPTDHPNATWYSLDLGEEYKIDLSQTLKPINHAWVNYPLGIFEEFRQHQIELPNIDFVLTSSIPIGGGLSSSAALTMSLATLFEQAVGIELDPVRKARWCQRAEHEFPKVPCGVMDPLIAVLAVEGHALLIDCAINDTKIVPMPAPDQAVLLVANTNVKHQLASSEYGQRKEECAAALKVIQQEWKPEVESLRDVTVTDLRSIRDLMDPLLFRRTMHVVTENLRVVQSVQALLTADLEQFGKYMFASHISLRDDYEVSCRELDTLVELAGEFSTVISDHDGGVYGARMTGGGFGGCAIVLCKPEVEAAVTAHLIAGHRAIYDRAPTIFSTQAQSGACTIELSQ